MFIHNAAKRSSSAGGGVAIKDGLNCVSTVLVTLSLSQMVNGSIQHLLVPHPYFTNGPRHLEILACSYLLYNKLKTVHINYSQNNNNNSSDED